MLAAAGPKTLFGMNQAHTYLQSEHIASFIFIPHVPSTYVLSVLLHDGNQILMKTTVNYCGIA
jgi:hypothetical protein